MVLVRTVIVLLALTTALPGESRYEIDLRESKRGWLNVRLETTCQRTDCDFQMPVWSATYQIRDFAQYVFQLEAKSPAGGALASRKVNPSRWRLQVEPGERVRVEYRVLADRPGPFGAYADNRYVSLNLAQVLIYPVDQRREPFTLRFVNVPPRWKTAVELPRHNAGYRAESYDRLVDTPVLLADFQETSFDHAGRPVRVVAYGPPSGFDLDLLASTARKVVSTATALMQDVPFPSYTFVYHFADVGGGGMEYRNGTSIFGPAKCGGCDLAALTAHEFFHAWNVKRIRPASLQPLDFTGPDLTPSLWFCEGVTSSYAHYVLLASGLRTQAQFLGHLSRLISTYEERPARERQSAEESSIEAWLERYPVYSRPDRSISYYLKGELIGYLLDLVIRHETRNRRSFDDVMRVLNQEYAQQGRFFEDTEALERISSRVAETDLSGVFDRLIRSAAPIRWDYYLGLAGFRLSRHGEPGVETGMSLGSPPGLGIVVSAVRPGGPADQAGVRRGDRIKTIDGKPLRAGLEGLQKKLRERAGQRLTIGVERDGALLTVDLRPRQVEQSLYQIIEQSEVSDHQRDVRRGWLERSMVPAGSRVSAPPPSI